MSSRILPEFELLVPQSLEEAVNYLSEHENKAAVMAGGTDLLVQMKGSFKCVKGDTDFDYIMSLAEVSELNYITYDDTDGLRIGAMATLTEVGQHPIVKEKYPALAQSIDVCGTIQTRNMGTVVGNLLNSSPCADCSCAILALGGSVTLASAKETREVDIDAFWLGYRFMARRPDEICVEVKLPPVADGVLSAHNKMTRVAHDLSKISASVRLDMDGKICKSARISMASVAPTTIRLKETEKLFAGKEINDALLEQVVATVPSEVNPIDDVRSSAEYRKEVSGIVVKRAVLAACGKM
jgi:carbon-monoxide dehydrogenase medium subunit